MRRFLFCVGFLSLWVSPLYAARLPIENTSGGTTTTVAPGTTSVTLTIIAVTESGDGLPGDGWFGGNGLDVNVSTTGSVSASLVPGDISIGGEWNDTGTNFTGSIAGSGVSNLVFSTTGDVPGPGDVIGDRVTIATMTVRLTGATGGDTIRVSLSQGPTFAAGTTDGQNVVLSSLGDHLITVQQSGNTPPTANPTTASVGVNQQVLITLTGSDPDGPSPLSFSVVAGFGPNLGTLGALQFVSATSRQVLYTAGGTPGADSFRLRVNDGLATDDATITVNVTGGGNTPPTANPTTASVGVNQQVLITLTGSDPDGPSPLSFSVVAGFGPTLGSLGALQFVSATSRQVLYSAGGVAGADSFRLRVNDGLATDDATITVNVTDGSTNTPPFANSQNLVTDQDMPKTITLTGSDADGDSLDFFLTSNVSAGTLAGTPPTITYFPPNGFNGTVSFTFRATDGMDSSLQPGTITIVVGDGGPPGQNQPPTANGQTVSTGVNQTIGITLTGNDPEGGALTFTVLTQPTLGTLNPAGGPNAVRQYTPGLNVSNVQDSFTFQVTDPQLATSAAATVFINIGGGPGPNRAPTVIDVNITTSINTSVPVVLSGSDPDGDALTFIIDVAPTRGFLTGLAPSNLTYNPVGGFTGLDTFTYFATDGSLNSNTGTVRITVQPIPNDPPSAEDQTVVTSSVGDVGIVLGASDPDGDQLSYAITSGPFNGLLTGAAPNVRYRPNLGFVGTDSFSFQVNDGTLDSNVATVTIVVQLVNNAPVADDQTVAVVENTPEAVTLTATDPDGDNLTFAIVLAPGNGSLSGIPPEVTYTPDDNFNGSDFFTFRANDGALDSNIARVSILVSPVNDPPTANPGANRAVECGSAVLLDGSGSSDPEGDALTYRWTGPFGEVSGVQPAVALELGANAITLVVNDGTSDSAPASVLITVEDTIAPSLICPDLELVNRTEPTGTPASNPIIQSWLASASATDECDSNPQVFHDAPSFFPLGRTDVTFMAIDEAGNLSECVSPMVVLITADGDLDGDGDVDAADFMAASQDFTGPGDGTSKSLADLNGDGSVDLVDWLLMQSLFTGSK